MPSTIFAADDHWAIWTALLLAAFVGIRLERTRWGARLSAVVITLLCTFALSNARVIPATAPAYGVVWSFFVPLAIPLLLFRADLRRIVREAGPTLLAFVVGGAGTVLGTGLAASLLSLGPQGHKLAGIFCATYIGGSINYAGAAEALGLRAGDLLSAGVAADNLMMTIYFLVLFALPSWRGLRQRFARRVPTSEGGALLAAPAAGGPSLETIGAALAISATACALGHGLERLSGVPGVAILALTALVVLAATLAPGRFARLAGAEIVGTMLLQVFFAAIGASANVGVVLHVGPVLFALAAIILAVHLASILLVGWLLRLDLAEIVIASNANMGGPTTAAAMAAACGWPTLVVPAILCGTLGYASATFVGVAVGHLLR